MQDPYLDDDFATERLCDEWKKYGKIFVCIDFDDTVFDFHKKGFTYPRVISLLKECQEFGCCIIIFTASEVEKYPAIYEHCAQIGLRVDSINKNAIPMPIGNNGKPYYNILLDDRGGLSAAYKILKGALEKVKTEGNTKTL